MWLCKSKLAFLWQTHQSFQPRFCCCCCCRDIVKLCECKWLRVDNVSLSSEMRLWRCYSIIWHLVGGVIRWCECAQSVKWMTSGPLLQTRSSLCGVLTRESGTTPRCLRPFTHKNAVFLFVFFNASPSLCFYVCLALRHWSDWLSCGCLSVCRISLQTRVFYSACLPDSCRSPRTQNSSLQITVFPSCRAVFVSCATWCYR